MLRTVARALAIVAALATGASAALAIGASTGLAGTATAAGVVYIRGAGNGHGVGMSQYGADGYALQGRSYQFILAHYYQGTSLATTNPNRIVTVLLKTGSAAFSGARKVDGKALKPGITYSVRALADGSIAIFKPSGKRVGQFAPPVTVTGTGPLTVAGLGAYRGSLEFRPDASGRGIDTINAVGLDDYLRGVVTAEMPASWAPQALDAQAVAARTYAITSDVDGSVYQLYSDTRSQAYGGVGAETPASDAAVAATSGQIVTYDGAPAITYFSASSGGYTEDVQNAFPGDPPEPWLVGVPDPYDDAAGNPYYRWGLRISLRTANSKLAGLVDGSLVGIEVNQQGVSPRILTATIVGTKGSTSVSGIELEHRFGLLSTWARFTTITTNAIAGTGPAATHNGTDHRPSKLTPTTALPRITVRALAGMTETALARMTTRAVARMTTTDLTRITTRVLARMTATAATRIAASTAADISTLMSRLLMSATPVIYGRIFPAGAGAALVVQELGQGAWHTVADTRFGAGGRYSYGVPGPGTYRVVFGSFVGPAVRVRSR